MRIKIEIPKGSNVKYEIGEDKKTIVVDRILQMPYLFNYGYIPETLWHDGDALDAILLGDFTLHPGVEVDAKPIGVVEMYDQGFSDYKVLFQLTKEDPTKQLPAIQGFLLYYKEGVKIDNIILDKNYAEKIVKESRLKFLDNVRYEENDA